MLLCKTICVIALLLQLSCVVICQSDNDGTFCSSSDLSSDNYDLHHQLEEGLAHYSKNLYNIQKAKLHDKTTSKIACLPVNYTLQCRSSDGNCSLLSNKTGSVCDNDINGIDIIFLWSSFDTSTTLGNLLLTYTIYDLRVFGFGWEDDCYVYDNSTTNITIFMDESLCVTKDDLCSALQYITTLVSLMRV